MHPLSSRFICLDWFIIVVDIENIRFADDIGSNIEHSHEATVQAKSELVKASKTQRSSSSLVYSISSHFMIELLILKCPLRPVTLI